VPPPGENLVFARTRLGLSKGIIVLKSTCIGLAALLGVAAVANGVFMLLAPEAWYFAVPGVTTTGAFNQHFIRDIGLIFLLMGSSFLAGALQPGPRLLLWAAPTIWLTGHALFHFWEVAIGICSASAIARDFPAVTVPAILGWLLTAWAFRVRKMEDASPLGSLQRPAPGRP
jgi:hypothetical protein